MAKRITGYQANDGTFFQKRADADKHDLTQHRKNKVEALVGDTGAKFVDSSGTAVSAREYLLTHADAILAALTLSKPTVKRPRKNKAPALAPA